ncbi:MAG: hypothetical protein ACREC9_12545 [Methylocella sp.]
MPETTDVLDQSGVTDRIIVRFDALVPPGVWRQALDRALAALEMPGIVVVLGDANTFRTIFLRDLEAGLRERGRAVTFTFLRADPPEPPAVADSVLVIEDAAWMDTAMLEAICRTPGRRVVLAGPSALVFDELPPPLTVVTFKPLPLGTAAAPSSTTWGILRVAPRSNARVAIASAGLAAACVAGTLLWTRVALAPLAPAPSPVAAILPTIELPPAAWSVPAPGEPASDAAALAPPPAPSASEQPGDATSAAWLAPLPARDHDRSGVATSLELPAVPVVAETGPRSSGAPASPKLEAGPSPLPDTRETLNLPPAAAIAPPPSEPAAPSGNAPQLLPDSPTIRVLVGYAPRSATARQEAVEIVRRLRGGGLAASDPALAARVAGKADITYFFAEDRDGARRVEQDLGEGFGPARLSPVAPGEPLPRPGTIEVLVPVR